MNVLIDTNVVLDQLVKREPFYENAERIRLLSEKRYINSYISASAITDIYYIANKELNDNEHLAKRRGAILTLFRQKRGCRPQAAGVLL